MKGIGPQATHLVTNPRQLEESVWLRWVACGSLSVPLLGLLGVYSRFLRCLHGDVSQLDHCSSIALNKHNEENGGIANSVVGMIGTMDLLKIKNSKICV